MYLSENAVTRPDILFFSQFHMCRTSTSASMANCLRRDRTFSERIVFTSAYTLRKIHQVVVDVSWEEVESIIWMITAYVNVVQDILNLAIQVLP